MIVCPRCSDAWPGGTAFCGSCGAGLARPASVDAASAEPQPDDFPVAVRGAAGAAPPPPRARPRDPGPTITQPPVPPFGGSQGVPPPPAGTSVPRTARRASPPTRQSGLPPVALGLLAGLAVAGVAGILAYVIEVPDLGDWSSLAYDVLLVQCFAIPASLGAAAAVLFGRGARVKDVPVTGIVIVGAGTVGGFVTGIFAHAWDPDYASVPWKTEMRIEWVVVFVVVGLAVGLAAAAMGQVPWWAWAITGGAGLVAGLLFAQAYVSFGDIYELVDYDESTARMAVEGLSALAAGLPIVFGAGLAAQIASAPSAPRRYPTGPAAPPSPGMVVPVPAAAGSTGAPVYAAAPTGAPTYYPAPVRTNGFAIASLVLGLLGCGSILAVIFGHVALGQIRRANGAEGGRGLAIAGLILGYIGLAIAILYLVLIIAVASSDPGY